jgi:hypothetical protein
MATREMLQHRVDQGAMALDSWDLDWWEVIDLDHLMMENGFRCVLGQLEESMVDDFRRPAELARAIGSEITYPRELGFAADEEDYPILQELWIEEILGREVQAEQDDKADARKS